MDLTCKDPQFLITVDSAHSKIIYFLQILSSIRYLDVEIVIGLDKYI